MVDRSAGILLYRFAPALEVLIGHMGGPFWARKDDAAWSIPKGLIETGEEPLAAALREFEEELGIGAPPVDYLPLGEFRQPSGKRLIAFMAESDVDVARVASNTVTLEWPPRSGRVQEFPEIDRAGWFPIGIAREKVVAGQVGMLAALAERLAGGG